MYFLMINSSKVFFRSEKILSHRYSDRFILHCYLQVKPRYLILRLLSTIFKIKSEKIGLLKKVLQFEN